MTKLRTIALAALLIAGQAMAGQRESTLSDAPAIDLKGRRLDCHTSWKDCKDNEELANHNDHEYFRARFDCREAANKMAKYGTPDWGEGWFQFPFTSYLPGDSAAETGKMILLENNAKFSNGFGAMAHVRVICVYNFNTKSVEDVEIPEQ